MNLAKFDITLLAQALRKQAEMLRQAGADVLAERLQSRGQSLEFIAIPIKTRSDLQRRAR